MTRGKSGQGINVKMVIEKEPKKYGFKCSHLLTLTINQIISAY